jgi:hypothetical protein
MLPYHMVDHFLRFTPAELREIVLEIRNIIFAEVPEAQEEIRGARLVYFRGSAAGPVKSGICGMQVRSGAVRVVFTHGALIPDPNHLLHGAGKAMRALEVRGYAQVPWQALTQLIEAHSKFYPASLPQNQREP